MEPARSEHPVEPVAERPFRVAFVPGVTPDKWVRRWRDRHPGSPIEVVPVDRRHQTAVLFEGRADMSLVRLPVERDGLHLIPLYTEVPVVVASRDHVVAAFERVHVQDLTDEHHWDLAEVSVAEAVAAVAAGTGVVVLPMSVARLHHRKDVVAVPVDGVEESEVGLAWRVGAEDPRLEEFVGIVRGRTARSSRGADGGTGKARPAKGTKGTKGAAGGKGKGATSGKGKGSARPRRPAPRRGRRPT
jgi:DNA-binding transcriptional LysR family regulator